MVSSSSEPTSPSITRNTIGFSSQESPRGIMDFLEVDAIHPHAPRLQERSTTLVSSSSSTVTPEAHQQSSSHQPPIVRLKPRYGDRYNSSLWSVNPNGYRQVSRDHQAYNNTSAPPAAYYIDSDFTSQRLLELQTGEIPSTLLVPLEF